MNIKGLNIRILLSFAMLIAAAAVIIGAALAAFSDTETSVGNTLAAGEIDLTIDNTSYYNGDFNEGTSWPALDLTNQKFFDFNDLKPDDYGEDTISIHVDTNDAYLCAEVTLTSDEDNTQTEPEAQDDPNGLAESELAGLVNFIWWADDGDNVLESDENVISTGPIGALTLDDPFKVLLADSTYNIWTELPGPISAGTNYYIGKAWCLGTIGVAPITPDGANDQMTPAGDNNDNETSGEPEDGGFTCDGTTLDNATQTDSLTADISFSAVQSRNNSDFVCEEDDVPPPPNIACTENTIQYADSVVSNFQGLRANGTAITDPNRTNPSRALGQPQHLAGNADDAPVILPSFYSVGFPHANNGNIPGSIVLAFAEPFYPNDSGPDFKVFEVTGGSYPDELIKVEVSPDGSDWTLVTNAALRDAELELPIPFAQYVRITEASDILDFEATADGYDLDGVQTYCQLEG